MAIFTNTQYVAEEVEVYDNIEPTMESASEILYEFSSDIYKLIGAVYVSDIMIEGSVTEGATDVEALVEATMNEFVKKVIAKLKELKNKIVTWFKKVIANIKKFFNKSKDFLKKYKKRIVDNFKRNGLSSSYEGYRYLEFEEIMDLSMRYMRPLSDIMVKEKIFNTDYSIDELERMYVTALQKGANDSTIEDHSAFKDSFLYKIRGNMTEPETIKVNNVLPYMTEVDMAPSIIDLIEASCDVATTSIDKSIAFYDIMRGASDQYITMRTSIINKSITVIELISTTAVSTIQEALGHYFKMLYDIGMMDEETTKESSCSIFESALGLV